MYRSAAFMDDDFQLHIHLLCQTFDVCQKWVMFGLQLKYLNERIVIICYGGSFAGTMTAALFLLEY